MPKTPEVLCPITKQVCPQECTFHDDITGTQLPFKRGLRSLPISVAEAQKQMKDHLSSQADYVQHTTKFNRAQRQRAAINGNPTLGPKFCFHQGDPLKKEP